MADDTPVTADISASVAESVVSDTAPKAVDVEAETTSPAAKAVQEKQTADEAGGGEKAPAVQPLTQAEKMVPFAALAAERKRRQELQRKNAEYEAARQYQTKQTGEGDDWNKILSHPYVQNMMLQQAKRDLSDFAKTVLDQYPQIPDPVRKAILKNPRGYVQETTQDIENAKLDLQEYVEALVDELGITEPAPPQKQAFQVAATNPSEVESKVTPKEVIKILEKPIDTWTDDEANTVAEYKSSLPK